MDLEQIKALVKEIEGHYVESDHYGDMEDYGASGYEIEEGNKLAEKFLAEGIELEDDEEEIQWLHIKKDGKTLLIFDRDEWMFREPDGELIDEEREYAQPPFVDVQERERES